MALAGVGIAGAHHEVTLEVNGVSVPVSGFASNVSDVLNTAGVEVQEHDLVAPGLDESISDGDVVVVRSATRYTLMADGQRVEAWSTGSSVKDILHEVNGGSVVLAADRSERREALPVLSDSSTLEVRADGQSVKVEASPTDSARSLLEKAGVEVSPIDHVGFTSDDGNVALQVTRVNRGIHEETETVDFETEEKEDDTLPEGTTSVVEEGSAGTKTSTIYEETVGDETVVRTVISQETTEPTNRVVLKGTKKATSSAAASPSSSSPATSSGGGAPAGDDAWAQLAQCESGGNPSTNTGNGYYGMYQFTQSTWASVGGSGLPSDASAEEQTQRAQALQARSGWGQWPACTGRMGLR